MKGISRIEEVYKYLGLTQEQFADKLGMSTRRIQQYMGGENVSQKFITAIERNFPQINTDYILEKSDVMLLNEISDAKKVDFVRNLKVAGLKNEIEFLKQQLAEKTEYIELLKAEIARLKK